MKKIVALYLSLIGSGVCFGGTGAEDSTIVSVDKGWFGTDLITLNLSGGAGPCANASVSYRADSITGGLEGLDQFMSLALTAKYNGSKVSIGVDGSDCLDARTLKVE